MNADWISEGLQDTRIVINNTNNIRVIITTRQGVYNKPQRIIYFFSFYE